MLSRAELGGRSVLDKARDILALSHKGLARRAILSISPQTAGVVLVHLLTTQEKVVSEVLLEFSQAVAARGKVEDLARLLDAASRRRQPEVTVIALVL